MGKLLGGSKCLNNAKFREHVKLNDEAQLNVKG